MLPVPIIVNTVESHMGGERVVDKTGLTGKYDFTLDYDPGALLPSAAPDGTEVRGPDFVSALREQLGLALERKNVPVEVLAIDSADDKPIEK
jgi:uncharacterized protein (TIGR03435 family)